MDDLSKQQLILVALLVSFVTSLATGIVTVSLMSQAPDGTTRTVSQVIEKTIQQIVPSNYTADSSDSGAATGFSPAKAVAKVQKGLVRFEGAGENSGGGIGIVVSPDGVILTDKSVIAGMGSYTVVLPNGAGMPVNVIRSQDNGDIVFLAPAAASPRDFDAVSLATSSALGQEVFSLSGTTTDVLYRGLIMEAPRVGSTTAGFHDMRTNISASEITPGSPLFNDQGQVIGMHASSSAGDIGAVFYPVSQLENVIPVIK